MTSGWGPLSNKYKDEHIDKMVLLDLARVGDKEAIKTLSRPPYNIKLYTPEEVKAYEDAHKK